MLATATQLASALALIELDGLARRIVLCPPGVAAEQLDSVVASASIDAIVTDEPQPARWRSSLPQTIVGTSPVAAPVARARDFATEWVLLTSGTTGMPKLVAHNLATLTNGIDPVAAADHSAVWSTFYDIRRYGGLQILLRALVAGGSLVLAGEAESTADFLARAAMRGVTHISGTPSHWRRVLMTREAGSLNPRYVRLSGEIADQALLDNLKALYPHAQVSHAFASTEAGVAFAVNDGLAGFPVSLVAREGAPVEIKVEEGSLRIRSPLNATGYIGDGKRPVVRADGFVDTGDVVEQRGDRFHFVGRRDGVINVGGQKVHPEEIEAVITRHPLVRMALVKAKRSPITGAIVVAEIMPKEEIAEGGEQAALVKSEILALCRGALAPYKVPAVLTFVRQLGVAASGKIARDHA